MAPMAGDQALALPDAARRSSLHPPACFNDVRARSCGAACLSEVQEGRQASGCDAAPANTALTQSVAGPARPRSRLAARDKFHPKAKTKVSPTAQMWRMMLCARLRCAGPGCTKRSISAAKQPAQTALRKN
jgi:hypothetical protein